MTRRSWIPLTFAMVVVAGACSSNNKVGSGVDLSLKGQVGKERLGQTTTTAAAAVSTTIGNHQLGVGSSTTSTTSAARTTTTATPTTLQQAALDIAINGDSGSTSQFDPSAGRVYKGSLVRWTNRDKQARSVEADAGTFNSGMLAPGASFTFRADAAGSFNYHDGTRPYAVGTLEVINR